MIPPGLLFALGHLSSWLMGGARFFQNGHLQRKAAAQYSQELCFQCPSLTTSHIHPCFLRMSSKNCGQVSPRFPWRLCFALGLSAHESLCAPFKNQVSDSPSPMELQHPGPTGFQCQIFRGSFSLCQIPTHESLMWGSELSLL